MWQNYLAHQHWPVNKTKHDFENLFYINSVKDSLNSTYTNNFMRTQSAKPNSTNQTCYLSIRMFCDMSDTKVPNKIIIWSSDMLNIYS